MKKVCCLVLLVLMVTALSGSIAYAQNSSCGDMSCDVEKANLKIESEIAAAVDRAEKLVDRLSESFDALDGVADADIRKAELIQDTIDKINTEMDSMIEKLIEKTDKTTEQLVVKAARQGVTVINEYIEVKIGDRTVLIDPSRVSGD